jgi:hypothetical protein
MNRAIGGAAGVAALGAVVLALLGGARPARAGDPPALGSAADDGPCGLPPEAKPQRIKGAEGAPPLPLPGTPLRRTERKREPAPPTLVGKVMWGERRSQTLPDGRTRSYADWDLDPSDLPHLLKTANQRLGVRYRSVPLDLASFSFDPDEVPVLYMSGKRAPPPLDPALRAKLRGYIEAGGTLWADACAGAPAFGDGLRRELAALFPDRPLARVPPDHPIFRSAQRVEKVGYSLAAAAERADGLPYLEGIEVGCRLAVIFSPYGLSCAWDSFHAAEGAKVMVGEPALQLGVNMVAYALAYFDLGKYLAHRKALEPAAGPDAGDFVFAQLRHGGSWDPDPSAFAELVKTTLAETSVRARFGRKVVALTDPDLARTPFIYLTGHGPLALTDEESAALGRYLRQGGFLFADACCGGLEFDRSFRRELARALPGAELRQLPRDHAIYSSFFQIDAVAYTPQVQATLPDLHGPALEAAAIGDEVRVVYSRFDLGCGWEGAEHPWTRGVERKDAVRIGVNVIVYALTH